MKIYFKARARDVCGRRVRITNTRTTKQTHKLTNKHTNTETNNPTNTHANKQTHQQTHKQTHKQTSRRTNKHSNKQTHKHTTQANTQTNTQTNKETNSPQGWRAKVRYSCVLTCQNRYTYREKDLRMCEVVCVSRFDMPQSLHLQGFGVADV